MAESVVSPIVETLLGKLRFLDDEQDVPLESVVHIINELKELKTPLRFIRAVLLDAEKLQVHYNPVRRWLKQLKDDFYDAEDMLEEVDIEGLRRLQDQSKSSTETVCNFTSLSKLPSLHSTMNKKQVKRVTETLEAIQKMRKRFEAIASNMYKFNFEERVHDDNREVRSQSFVDASDVLEREKIKEEIISTILLGSHDVTPGIFSILGDSGIGKTTLAELVYNDKKIDDHFEAKMWTNFSQKFVNKKIILDMIYSVTENIENDNLIRQVQKILRNKKYLLVIDDVLIGDETKWKKFVNLLPKDKNGSRIIVITNSNKVESMVGTRKSFKLEWLSYESGLSIFKRCAFEEGKAKNPNLIKIAELIVKNCLGQPLLLKMLARALYFSTDEDDWKYVKNTLRYGNLKVQKDKRATASVVKLSYDLLPPHLKQCFACCSIFSKDGVFNNITLIQFWMAHGLLRCDGEEPESVGMRCINELRSRCFFQDFEHNFDFITFKMHDLVDELTKNEFLEAEPFLKRSMLFLEMMKPSQSLVKQSPNLRAVDLRNSVGEVLPESIGNLQHLRYLNLTKCIKLKRLPSSIFMLTRLETLLLGGCKELEELPKDIRHLINLRMLVLSSKQTHLPVEGIEGLTSLRCLGIGSCYNLESLFKHTDQLQALRTLIIVNCPRLSSFPPAVKNLSSLEKLMISYRGMHDHDHRDLKWDIEYSDEEFSSLKSHLRELCIDGFKGFEELPPWLLQGSANTLQWLEIKNCPDFARLPAEPLKILKSLEVLRISRCPKFSTLPEDMNSLTAMREFKVRGCGEFREYITGEGTAAMISHIPKVEIDGKQIDNLVARGSSSEA